MIDEKENLATATLAGGCFWCLEAVFEQFVGVARVESGYTGGTLPDPTYEDVCSGESGHAEVVRIRFDPARISYEQLLDVFFSIHDSTTPNRQGHDVGSQYRSAIFTHDDAQHRTALAKIAEVETAGEWGAPVVTEVVPAGVFYPAEGIHQGYFRTNPAQGYCAFVVAPKVREARRRFTSWLNPSAQ
jgi:peptide-methionine (S)-S-oxide reductase